MTKYTPETSLLVSRYALGKEVVPTQCDCGFFLQILMTKLDVWRI